MCSRSFGEPVTELPALTEIVSQFASRVAEKARGQQSVAGAVQVFITTSPYRQRDAQHSASVTAPLLRPSSDSRLLIGAAVRTLEQMYRRGFNYVKAGVMLVDLRPQGQMQEELDLFAAVDGGRAEVQRPSKAALMGTLDLLNQRFGRGAVSVASSMQRDERVGYVSKQERRSPRYTTRLEEIPTAHTTLRSIS